MPIDDTLYPLPPGSLHEQLRFFSTNAWGIPDLLSARIEDIPHSLVWYGRRFRQHERSAYDLKTTGVHFFLEDYRFECAWTKPQQTLQHIQQYGVALTPDFSVYADWPRAMNLWNVYRSRWVGAYWQLHQIRVIPTLSWGLPETYEFAFLGIRPGSVVAISTHGVLTSLETESIAAALFYSGLHVLVSVLRPACILCYGRITDHMLEIAPNLRSYPTQWSQIRQAMRRG